MRLSEIYREIPCEIHGPDAEISGIAYDSRAVQPGDLFFCIAGFNQDGSRFAKDAAAKGAAALAVTRVLDGITIPQVVVENDRRGMALASAAFYGHPAHSMRMIGITGTNGKTTTTYMIKHIAEQAGHRVGLIGTIRNMIGQEELHTERTTPEAPDLHRLLRTMADEGCDTAVMEVSSHSLALDRTYGIPYDIGIFSNLTQDHLDFHGDFASYLAAKALLFEQSKVSLVNIDDPHAEEISRHAAGSCRSYGIASPADFQASSAVLSAHRTQYELRTPEGEVVRISVPIPGTFSVYNSLAAAAASLITGISPAVVSDALWSMPSVDGRFELLDTQGRDFTLILDYAHTPDSLENTLTTVREFAQGRVLTVFGCGGNRDRTKRPLMGQIAAELSDVVFVTSDNPRFEDPDAIICDIMAGIEDAGSCIRITDRRQAIKEALSRAAPGDVIVLAGKGHETYQEICGVKHDFDEKVVVREVLGELDGR